MNINAVSARDPFEMGRFGFLNPSMVFANGYATRTPVSPVQIAEVCKGVLFIGDSAMANSSPTAYTVTQAKNHNLNTLNGGLYVSADPLLGGGNGVSTPFLACAATRIGDLMISGGYCARSIIANAAAGGSIVADWAAGGNLNKNISASIRRFSAVGLPLSAVVWHGGPNDNSIGTSQAAYTALLASVIATIRALSNAPILVGVCSKANGVDSAPIQAAQAAAVNNPAGIYAGVNTDAYTAGNFQDGTHLSDAGCVAFAPDGITKLHAAGAF